MLLTVPSLYYKPIQERALKIKGKGGEKKRQEEQKRQVERGRRGGVEEVVQGTREFKSNTVSFMFKGTFLFLSEPLRQS